MAENNPVSVADNSFPVAAPEEQSVPVVEEPVVTPDPLEIAQTAVPKWETARINAPFANETKTAPTGLFTTLNLLGHGAMLKWLSNTAFSGSMVMDDKDYTDEYATFAAKPYDEQVKETADMVKRIDDPAIQRLVGAGAAVIDTFTWTQNPALSEVYASMTAGKDVYNSLSMALPMGRDLLIAVASMGAYGLPALAATFGSSSGLSAWNRAEAVRATTGQDYIHPATAFAIEGSLNYILPRYISAPAQLSAQKMLNGLYQKVLPSVTPRAAQLSGAVVESTAENVAQNYAIGNAYSIFGHDQERMSNMQLTGMAVLAAAMEVPQNPHALGFKPAEKRITDKVNERIGGQPNYDIQVDSMEPAFGMSVYDVNRTTPLSREINGAELADATMRKVFGEVPIGPDGIRRVDQSIEPITEKSDTNAVIAQFKKNFEDKGPSVVKRGTPVLMKEMKAQVLETREVAPRKNRDIMTERQYDQQRADSYGIKLNELKLEMKKELGVEGASGFYRNGEIYKDYGSGEKGVFTHEFRHYVADKIGVSKIRNEMTDSFSGLEKFYEDIRKGGTPLMSKNPTFAEMDELVVDMVAMRHPDFMEQFPDLSKKLIDAGVDKYSKDMLPWHLFKTRNSNESTATSVVGPDTSAAYQRMIKRANEPESYTDTKDGATDLDDFAQVVSHQAVRAMLDGGKPSTAFEAVGITDPVVLEHVDSTYTTASSRKKLASDWEKTDPEFFKKVSEIDSVLSDAESSTLMKGNRAHWAITDNFIKTAKRDVERAYPPLSKEGKKASEDIVKKLTELRAEYRDKITQLKPNEGAGVMYKNGKQIKEYVQVENESFFDTAAQDADWAIDAFDLKDTAIRILNRADNAKLAASMNARVNYDLQGTRYQLPEFSSLFDEYDGLLTNKQFNQYARSTFSITSKIAEYGREMGKPENHNRLFGSGVKAISRALLGGDISMLDNAALKSKDDPISYDSFRNAVEMIRATGVVDGHIDSALNEAKHAMDRSAKALVGTDDETVYHHRASVMLDIVDDARIKAAANGEELETVVVQGPVTRFKAPKILVDMKYPAGEIQFAMKYGNFNHQMDVARNTMNDSLTAINPARLIRKAAKWNSVSSGYEGHTWAPRTINEEGMSKIDEGIQYRKLLPSERVHVNRTIGRKPESMLSRGIDPANPYRDAAHEEYWNYYNKEWRYAMTQAQVNKFLDYGITQRYGYKQGKTQDGKDTAQLRRFWSSDTGIEDVAVSQTTKEGAYNDAVIESLLAYKRQNDMGVVGKFVESASQSPEMRAMRSLSDVIMGVPGNLMAKGLIGFGRGPLYAIASTLQGVQQSFSYMSDVTMRHPLQIAKGLAKAQVLNAGYLVKRGKYGMINTLAKYEKGRTTLEKLGVKYDKYTDARFQKEISRLWYKKGNPEYNKAFREYIENDVPMFYRGQKWDIDAAGDMFERGQREWQTAKLSMAKARGPEAKPGDMSIALSDYVRAWTSDLNAASDFMVWTVNSADAASKAWSHDFAWEHFDRVTKRFGWKPKDADAALQKKQDIYRELHGDLFSDSEFSRVTDYLAIGDTKNAQKLYARLFAETTTPSFTSANRSQFAKAMSQGGEVGRMTGRFSEWTFKAIPNMVQVVNEAKRGNYAPIIVTTMSTMAFYEMYNKWLEWYGESEDVDDKNIVGKDIMNTMFARNFQDVIGMGVMMGNYIGNQFNEDANRTQKMAKPSLPMADRTFLTSYLGFLWDASVSVGDEEKFDKLMKNRVPGYREAVLAMNGEYAETKLNNMEDFVDFWMDYADNKLAAIIPTTGPVNTKKEISVESKPETRKEKAARFKKENALKAKETVKMAREIIKRVKAERKNKPITTTAGE